MLGGGFLYWAQQSCSQLPRFSQLGGIASCVAGWCFIRLGKDFLCSWGSEFIRSLTVLYFIYILFLFFLLSNKVSLDLVGVGRAGTGSSGEHTWSRNQN